MRVGSRRARAACFSRRSRSCARVDLGEPARIAALTISIAARRARRSSPAPGGADRDLPREAGPPSTAAAAHDLASDGPRERMTSLRPRRGDADGASVGPLSACSIGATVERPVPLRDAIESPDGVMLSTDDSADSRLRLAAPRRAAASAPGSRSTSRPAESTRRRSPAEPPADYVAARGPRKARAVASMRGRPAGDRPRRRHHRGRGGADPRQAARRRGRGDACCVAVGPVHEVLTGVVVRRRATRRVGARRRHGCTSCR